MHGVVEQQQQKQVRGVCCNNNSKERVLNSEGRSDDIIKSLFLDIGVGRVIICVGDVVVVCDE